MEQIDVGGIMVPVCQSCLDGNHNSYGKDHRIGQPGRCDCKNLSSDKRTQCACNPDWPELVNAITTRFTLENAMADRNTKLDGIELFYWLVKTRGMTESRAVETMQNNNQDMRFVDDVREFLKSDAVIPVEKAWILTKLVKCVEG